MLYIGDNFEEYSACTIYLDDLSKHNDGDEIFGIDLTFSTHKKYPHYFTYYKSIYRPDKDRDDIIKLVRVSISEPKYIVFNDYNCKFTKEELSTFKSILENNLLLIRYHLLAEYRYGDRFNNRQFYNYLIPDYSSLKVIE